jgi:NADH dehydrogenase
MSAPIRHVVIVGGGFGGLACARALAGAPVQITLVDRRNHHLFQPLLYQVAGAALSPAEIAAPLRVVLRKQPNCAVMLGEVTRVNPQGRSVEVLAPDGPRSLHFDALVVAAGMRNAWFGKDREWAPFAPGMKDLDDALEVRRRILLAFERAEWANSPEERHRLLTFVVVGAGPTGVELAGALVEIARRSLARDFRRINPTEARVVLIEGAPGVLPPYPPELRRAALEHLLAIGVEVRVGHRVQDIGPEGVSIVGTEGGAPEFIPSATVLWAAGLRAVPLADGLGVAQDRLGRLVVGPDLSLPGHPWIFAIGDLAASADAEGRPHPGVAQNAIQGGTFVAGLIAAGTPPAARPRYAYTDRGSMAVIGRSRAVVAAGPMQLSGRRAWVLWLFVHLMALVGYRNRLMVFLQWAMSFLTWERSGRLIRDRERAAALPGAVTPLAPPSAPPGSPP